MLKYNTFKYIIQYIGKIWKFKTLENPIFIIGTGRCGTSLLLRILKSNKELAVFPSEANELWHPNSFSHIKAKISSPPILLSPQEFTNISIKSWPLNHENKIKSIFEGFFLIKRHAYIFVQKSAMISFMIPLILSIFPNSKFIHIYRNPISVIASIVEKEWNKYNHLFSSEANFRLTCAKYWGKCIIEIDNQKKFMCQKGSDILFELSYESLCKNPINQLNTLATFIGCNPKGFTFDLSKIKSTNYKVGNYRRNDNWLDIIECIKPIMEEKGYLT
jgi:hypothetical protein